MMNLHDQNTMLKHIVSERFDFSEASGDEATITRIFNKFLFDGEPLTNFEGHFLFNERLMDVVDKVGPIDSIDFVSVSDFTNQWADIFDRVFDAGIHDVPVSSGDPFDLLVQARVFDVHVEDMSFF